MLNVLDWLWIGIVPFVLVLGIIMKRIIKQLHVGTLSLVFTIIAVEQMFYASFNYSSLSYLGLLFTLLGIVMLFYNYKIDHLFTVRQFLVRWLYAYSNIMIIVWGIITIYRLITVLIK